MKVSPRLAARCSLAREFGKLFGAEIAKWATLLKLSGVKTP
jgi:hypothetical protein